MRKIVLFEEVQTFGKKSAKSFFIIANILLVAALIFSIFFQGLGNEITVTLISAFLIFAIITYVVQNARLITQIYEDGIAIKFRPFFGASKRYNWEDIDSLYVREYNPVAEYGGWGIKISANGNGLAFTTSGTLGLQMILKDGKRILIGTGKDELLATVLMRLGKLDY